MDSKIDKKLKLNTTTPTVGTVNKQPASQIGQVDAAGLITLRNNAKSLMTSKEPLSLHEDQLHKQLVNTIREVLKQFFEDLKHVIPANDKLLIFTKTYSETKGN